MEVERGNVLAAVKNVIHLEMLVSTPHRAFLDFTWISFPSLLSYAFPCVVIPSVI